MANTKGKTTKKTSPKKIAKKPQGMSEQDKRTLWLVLTIIVVLTAYFIFEFFA